MTEQKKPEDITIEEKAVIFDILKFTPADYNIQVYGYGGDSRFLRSTKEQYKYFKENDIDIETFAHDWDNEETKVPEEFQPFPAGSPYDGSELECASGATMDDCSHIEVSDENGNVVFSCTMDPASLEEQGITVNEVSEFCPEFDCKKGDVIIWHGNGEKGTFFGAEHRLTKPFDPKLLTVNYIDVDGWPILSSVEYDSEELDNYDYSTTGKWSETKWIVVGGEEELDKEPEIKIKEVKLPPTTEWFPAAEYNPVHKGVYECRFGGTIAWPFATEQMVEWTGKKWKTENQISLWRGLTEEVK